MSESHLGPYRIHRSGTTAAERRAFARVATAYLAKREAANSLPLAVVDHVATGHCDAPVLLLAEDRHGDTGAVLIRTPPYALLVASGDASAAREALLERLLADGERLPGMVGPLPEVADAASWWSEHAGTPARRRMHQGAHRLRAVTTAPRAAGRMRAAGAHDRHLVVSWLEAFARETRSDGDADPERVWESYQQHALRRLVLWEVPSSRVVSVAGVSGRTPNGFRIGPVFTPSAERRHGYAGALVAALSQSLLDAGARACYLTTDLADATSNHVYRAIGYEWLGEAAEYVFG